MAQSGFPKARAGPQHDPSFFPSGQSRMRLRKDVVMNRFDFRKDAAVDTDERPERGPAVTANQIKQGNAFFVESPGTIGFETHQLQEGRARHPAGKIVLRASIALEIFLRKINTAHGKILCYIAQDI